MEFGLSDEQKLLDQTVKKFVEKEVPLERVRELAADRQTFDATIWKGLNELGLFGIMVPEQYGGAGLNLLDAVVVQEHLGRQVVPAAYLSTAILAPVALLNGASEAQKDTWLPKIAAGEVRVAVGVSDLVEQRESSGIRLKDNKLSGKSLFVIDGQDADLLLLAVGPNNLALVDKNASGVRINELTTVDKTRGVVEVVLEDVEAELLGSEGQAGPAISRLIDCARVALAADSLGACQVMLDKAVAYSLERKQFKRVIGSFQAVKHMCAEMAAQIEPCRALVWYAAHAYDEIPEEAPLMACHAKAHVADVGQFVSVTATQVFGGMGFTDLVGLHYWFKRIGLNRQLLGGPEAVRQRAAELQGWI